MSKTCSVHEALGRFGEDVTRKTTQLTHGDPEKGSYETFGYFAWCGADDVHNWAMMGHGKQWRNDTQTGLETLSNLDSPAYLASFDILNRMIVREQLAPGPGLTVAGVSGDARSAGNRLFYTDKVGMLCIGRWVLCAAWKMPGFRYGVTILPTPPGVDQPQYRYAGRTTAITRDCRNVEAAWKFLKYLTGEDYNRILVGQADGVAAEKALTDKSWHLFQPDFPEVQLRMYDRILARFEDAMAARVAGATGPDWADGLSRQKRMKHCVEAWQQLPGEERERLATEGVFPLAGVPDTQLAKIAAEEWRTLDAAEQQDVRDEVTAELRLNLHAMPHSQQPIPSPYCFGPQWQRLFGRAYEKITQKNANQTPEQVARELTRKATTFARQNADPEYGREKYRLGNRIGLGVVAAFLVVAVVTFRHWKRRITEAVAKHRPVIAGRKETFSEKLTGFAFVTPNLLGFAVFTAFPVGFSLVIAFTDWNSLAETVRFVGFDNFVDVVWNRKFWFYFANTVILLLSMPLVILGSLVLAVILHRKIRGTTFFRTIYYIPSLVSGVAVLVLWKWVFDPKFGLLNMFIKSVVPSVDPPAWLLSDGFGWPWMPVYPALYLMGIWGGIGGTNMLLYLAGLSSVPPEMYEAADIDGAGRWNRFWRITWPLVAPTTFFVTVMSMIGGLQGGVDLAYVMTGGGPNEATTTVGYFIFMEAFFQFKMGLAAAAAWILFVFIFVLTVLTFRYGNKGYF